jgi:predicted glycosyltransferase
MPRGIHTTACAAPSWCLAPLPKVTVLVSGPTLPRELFARLHQKFEP